jgi:hypothetical protein
MIQSFATYLSALIIPAIACAVCVVLERRSKAHTDETPQRPKARP